MMQGSAKRISTGACTGTCSRTGNLPVMVVAGKLQIAHSPDGKEMAVITDQHTYAWAADSIPAIVAALREHAQGHAMPGAGGMVFSHDDRVCFTDKPVKQTYQNVDGEAGLVIEHEDWTYAMPRQEARVLADNLEAVHRSIGNPSVR